MKCEASLILSHLLRCGLCCSSSCSVCPRAFTCCIPFLCCVYLSFISSLSLPRRLPLLSFLFVDRFICCFVMHFCASFFLHKQKHLFSLTNFQPSFNKLSDPLADAQEMYVSAVAERSALWTEHTANWVARNNAGRIEISGDLELAQAINASVYFLRSSIRPDWPYGMSPGGLASNGYDGNTFWDQETWMWPNLLLLDAPVWGGKGERV